MGRSARRSVGKRVDAMRVPVSLALAALALAGLPSSGTLDPSGPTGPAGQVAVQGLLFDAAGTPLSGEQSVTFRVFDSEEGGDCASGPSDSGCLWEETQTLSLIAGVFEALLPAAGADVGFTALFTGTEPRWIELEPAGAGPQPRTPVIGLPFALTAFGVGCEGCLAVEALAPEVLEAGRYHYDAAASGLPADDVQSAVDALADRADGGARVPIGSVIDWYRFDAEQPIPEGYAICDGSVLDDPESPLDGQALPDLTDRFALGVGPDRIGEVGGAASGDHAHSYTGTTDGVPVPALGPTITQAGAPPLGGEHDHGVLLRPEGGIYLAEENHSDDSMWTLSASQHTHPHDHPVNLYHEHGLHTHTVPGTTSVAEGLDNRPPYVGLLKLIRTR